MDISVVYIYSYFIDNDKLSHDEELDIKNKLKWVDEEFKRLATEELIEEIFPTY